MNPQNSKPDQIQALIAKIPTCPSLKELDQLRLALLGRRGLISEGFAGLKSLDAQAKKSQAAQLNIQKEEASTALAAREGELESVEFDRRMREEAQNYEYFDEPSGRGGVHPVMMMMDRIIDYFVGLNFSVQSGGLIEDDFHNFQALNLPPHHPARDMQDTFYFEDGRLLRTHTSPVQIRTMLSQRPPIRMIAPGAVFRRDLDLTHTPMFHQIEGLVVEEGSGVSFANLKSILEEFLLHIFGEVRVRFRPSFFPFTEPSAEVDISCVFCQQQGCRVCKGTGWLEVLGCGVVDPHVYGFVGYEGVSGYAFGLGVERFAMLAQRIGDLRSLFEGDLRLLEQFR